MFKDTLINALIEGRKVRPKHSFGVNLKGEDEACALGAIAIGLGYENIPNPSDGDSETVYDFIDLCGFSKYKKPIYSLYDNTLMQEYDKNRNKDAAGALADAKVIDYIRSL